MSIVMAGGPPNKVVSPAITKEMVTISRHWNSPQIYMKVRSSDDPKLTGGIRLSINLADYWTALAQELQNEVPTFKTWWLPKWMKRKIMGVISSWIYGATARCGQTVVEKVKQESSKIVA